MTWWIGEPGVLTPLTLVVAAVIYSRGRWTVIRSLPRREEVAEAPDGSAFPVA